ncbi:MAG: hypothetical protein AB9873_00825 [Syntrophobacteraceae bacterium]
MKRSSAIFPVACFLCVAVAWTAARAQDFGHKGGPDIANIAEITNLLRQETYDLELLLSFGTSKGGSAGHLALAIRDQAPGDDLVYSANFYADRTPEHASGFYIGNLICTVPKSEYLFKTTSSLGPDASFGLDMGEIYKRSVIGIRIFGVPKDAKDGLTRFFQRLNEDYHARKDKTDYHPAPIVYGYMRLNCAKTVALAFKHGAGFRDIPIKGEGFQPRLGIVSATKANVPTETALSIVKSCAKRGYRVDVVLYKKWDGSTYINPRDEGGIMYKDLPNRFPSVLSLDYREEQGSYEDYDNLYAMYLLYNLGRYSIVLDGVTRQLKVEAEKAPDSYEAAKRKAREAAKRDKKHLLRRLIFRTWGIKLDGKVDNTKIFNGKDLKAGDDGKPSPDIPLGPDK